LNLFLDHGAGVERLDARAKTFRSGDRLQAGNAGADDEQRARA
jgi:hypothetical protein